MKRVSAKRPVLDPFPAAMSDHGRTATDVLTSEPGPSLKKWGGAEPPTR